MTCRPGVYTILVWYVKLELPQSLIWNSQKEAVPVDMLSLRASKTDAKKWYLKGVGLQ
jgi:hypothetical protein